MLITLNQLKASLVAFKNWVLARIPSKTSDLTNDSNFITTADIPTSSDTTLGLAKPVQEYGTISDRNGGIAINSASSSEIREGRNSFKPIVPYSQHDAVYYGLIKIANDTDRRYSAEDATAIRALIGAPSTLDIPTKVSELVDDSGHYIKPSTGIPASDLASGVVPVQDVRINMGSLLDSEGVANIPIATKNTVGLSRANNNYGTSIYGTNNDSLGIYPANGAYIKQGENPFLPIVPASQEYATFYGLAKIAGHDEKDSNLAVGTYTDEAKAAIKTMLGVEDPVDVQINGTSIVSEGVANIPVAGTNRLGTVLVKNADLYGLTIDSDGNIRTYPPTSSNYKAGAAVYKPVCISKQHESTFYGLAKAAGDTTQSTSDNPVGTYTDSAKTSIKTMLGVEDPVDVQINGTSIVDNGVANIPVASFGQPGVVEVMGSSYGIKKVDGAIIGIAETQDSLVKAGTHAWSVITPRFQHKSVFYGLAKAAGDTTQSASSNAVGTYTDEAKAAIKTMLGIDTITVDSIPTTEIDTLFA